MAKTIREIIETMNDEQQKALYALVDTAMEDVSDEELEDEDVTHSDFDVDAERETIFREARRNGSLKDAFLEHADSQGYGIEEIEQLFPDPKLDSSRPHFINNRNEWVNHILKHVHKLPFSRVKTMFSDISADTLHAKGYTKTHKKVEDVISLLKRTTEPTTIYKKGKLDRDDIVDITDFDVVAWIKEEMRMKLDEEIARTILIGDGRDAADEFKIDEECIRPIYNDDDLFAVKVDIKDTDTSNRYKDIIAALVRSRKLYRGSGTPDLYTTDDVVSELLLLEDTNGRYIYKSEEELKSILRVKNIVIVNEMNGLTRETSDGTKKSVYGIITNIADYAIGADRGGSVSMFDDFDIDYNQQKFLMETRCSGSLLKPYSALVIEGRDNGLRRPTVEGPAGEDSNVYVISSLPTITKTAEVTLNSGSNGTNYLATMFDLNQIASGKKVTTATVNWDFTIKNTSQAKPTAVKATLIANNDPAVTTITGGYNKVSAVLQNDPAFGTRYKLSATYDAADGNSTQLNAQRYLKPFLTLVKSNASDTTKVETHDLTIHGITITVDGKAYDVISNISDFGTHEVTDSKSKIKVISTLSETQDKPYSGKVAGFIGDSITFGLDPYIGNVSIAMGNTWVEQLESLCGFSASHNYGISSSTVSTKGENPNWGSGDRNPMCTRYTTQLNLDSYDVIGIKGSINDFWLEQAVGTPEDTGTTTIYGAFDTLYKGMKEKFPNAKIFAMLPIDFWNDDDKYKSDPQLNLNDSDVNLDEYRTAIKTVAARYDIPVLDLQSSVKFDLSTAEGRAAHVPDGLHPNQAGADKMAAAIATFINTKLK